MRIQIIAEGSTKRDRSLKQWGLSILIDTDVLFDTFCNAETLKSHFQKYRVDVRALNHVVISHEHWDHTGGLWWVLANAKECTVYVCRRNSEEFKNKIKSYGCRLIEVGTSIPVRDDVFTTGEIEGNYDNQPIVEQSLILRRQGRLAVITGCSHPGIPAILIRVGLLHKEAVDMIIGGFHLMRASEQELLKIVVMLDEVYKVNTVAPFHCTGKKAIKFFKKTMPRRLVTVRCGDIFDFNAEKSSWERTRGDVLCSHL